MAADIAGKIRRIGQREKMELVKVKGELKMKLCCLLPLLDVVF